ncbi:hypothetical protein [Arthrobacter sp. I3]|uniref:hypothetical protein n=1 Tax=Arthrobacter sp. I3 TaxID=218158 RepID=UPI0031B8034D
MCTSAAGRCEVAAYLGFVSALACQEIDSYRNPSQLPDGAVLIVGTGQSGGQIAKELLAVGREVHLAVSTCPEAPRRYRGQDLLYWMMQLAQFGPDYGLNGLIVGQLSSPAVRP